MTSERQVSPAGRPVRVETLVRPAPASREEWVDRCAARLMDRAGLVRQQAEELAADLWMGGDLEDSPEGIADEELTYWAADAE